MLPRYIQDKILNGEGLTVDFKHSIADSYKIAKSLVSFANAVGGMLIIGVDDKGRVVGVDEEEETYMLDIAAQKYCKPNLEISYKRHVSGEGKVVLECNVNRGNSGPYTCKEMDGKWYAYFRQEDKCKLASIVRFKMMELQRSDEVQEIFTEQHKLVIELLRKNSKGLTKNEIFKKMKFSYYLTVSILARLMYLNVLEENISLNKTLYILK